MVARSREGGVNDRGRNAYLDKTGEKGMMTNIPTCTISFTEMYV